MTSDEDNISPPILRPPLHNSSSPRDKEPEEDKLRKWQEERIARRLRGEYESAIMHLSELVSTYSLLIYKFLTY